MNKQALSLAAYVAAGYPGFSYAIGLGDIKPYSGLNQPLNANIELLSTQAQEVGQIKVRLAAADVFKRIGIERPDYLQSLRFSAKMQNGKPIISVTSNQPVNEPFVNFLLEVSWPQGQLLKEYTILLDPPVLMQGGNAQNNTASVRAEPKVTGVVNRPAAAPVENPSDPLNALGKLPPAIGSVGSRAIVANNEPAKPKTSKYRVRSGDTLSSIAKRVKPRGITSDQMMLALFRANPNAFRKGNINYLNAGAVLNVPNVSQAQSSTHAEAKRVVRQHYAEWKKFRAGTARQTVAQKSANTSGAVAKQNITQASNNANPNPRLEVMSAKSQAANNANATADGKLAAAAQTRLADLQKQLSLAREALVAKKNENENLKSRVTELESMVNKKNRLIQLKSQQLASAQNSLRQTQAQVAQAKQAANQTNAPTQAATEQAEEAALSPAQLAAQQRAEALKARQEQAAQQAAQQAAANQLATQVANQDNNAGQVNRAVPTPVEQAIDQADNAQVANQGETLSPVQLEQKRREAEAAQQADNAAAEAGFKPPQSNSLLDFLSSPIVAAAGAGSILLLLIGWLLLSRRKSKPEKDPDNVILDDFDQFDKTATKEPSLEDDKFDLAAQKAFQDELAAQDSTSPAAKPTDVTHAGDDLLNKTDSFDEEDDVLQEADVYIVYGLHDQAETELKKAMTEHPQKLEYRHKLLENYLASNNKAAFDQQAEAFLKAEGANKDALWQKIAEMGRKISPDNVLYKQQADSDSSTTILAKNDTSPTPTLAKADSSTAESSSATGAVAGAGLAAAAGVAAVAATQQNDDSSSTITPEAKAGESGASSHKQDFDDDLDLFALDDDLDRFDDTTEPMLDKTVVRQSGNSSSELSESQANLTHNAALADDLATTPAAHNRSNHELSLKDFDDDLSDIDDMDFGDLDDAFSLDDLEKELDQSAGLAKTGDNKPKADPNDHTAQPPSNDNIIDFDAALADSQEDKTSHQTNGVNDVNHSFESDDLDLTNLSLQVGSEGGIGKILPSDTPYTSNGNRQYQEPPALEDNVLDFLDLPDDDLDLHDAHISTKLDLARAYLDMGDIEGARSTLEEVMVEGSDSQRQEAEHLLHQTG
ncbi:MAG: FimV/HubP family polar landmark protein [bacterium]